MFEILSEKLGNVFRLLGNRGKLTEKDIDDALRQVRLALLEADVNFKVVKDFTTRVRERSIGAEVLESLTPAQQIIKIVNEELIATLGDGQSRLVTSSHPPCCGKSSIRPWFGEGRIALRSSYSGYYGTLPRFRHGSDSR